MQDNIYNSIELTGSSKISIEDAVTNAIAKAAKTMHNIRWFEVLGTRGYVENGEIAYWQVTIKLAYTLD